MEPFEGEFVASEPPAQFPPTEPGVLDVGPRGLVLRVGETATLRARLFDSMGAMVDEAPSVSFESSDPSVVTVAESGEVEAVGEGLVAVIARSPTHGEQSIAVEVGTPLDGPTGLQVTPPFLTMEAGESRSFTAVATDARGNPLPGVPVTLNGEGMLEIVGDEVTAAAEGTYEITGTTMVGGETRALVGGLSVVVGRRGASTSAPHIIACNPVAPPWVFFTPGLSAPLRLELIESTGAGAYTRRQVAPTRVDVLDDRVVEIGSMMNAVAPGTTRYQLHYNDTLCTCETVHVFPSLDGSWHARACDNGDEGGMSVSGWPRRVVPRWTGAYGGRTIWTIPVARGMGCYANDAELTVDDFFCEAEASLRTDWSVSRSCFGEIGLGPCSPETPCGIRSLLAVEATHCAASRHAGDLTPGGAFVGPDEFVHGICAYERGAYACDPPPPPDTPPPDPELPTGIATYDGREIMVTPILTVSASGGVGLSQGDSTLAFGIVFQGPTMVGSYAPCRNPAGICFEDGDADTTVTVNGVTFGPYCAPPGLPSYGTATISMFDEVAGRIGGSFDVMVFEPEAQATCGSGSRRLVGSFEGPYRMTP